MVDFHTHILPGIDDGAKNLEDSRQMLKSLSEQKVKNICLTPHFYAFEESLDDFLIRRQNSYEKIQNLVKDIDAEVFLGCEMYFTDTVFNLERIPELCINNTKYLLVELPYDSPCSKNTASKLQKFICDKNITPVLAHIDRYPEFLKNSDTLDMFLDMGCYAQINLYSLDSGFFTRRKIIKYIEEKRVHFWGTDCHNMTTRKPAFEKYIKLLNDKLGNKLVSELSDKQIKIIKD